MKRYLLSIILCLWASCSWAFSSGFIGAVASGGAPAGPTLKFSYTGLGATAGELVTTSEATTVTATGVTFNSDGANLLDSGDYLYVTATNATSGSNINFLLGTMEFVFKRTGTMNGWERFVYGKTSVEPLVVLRNSTTNNINIGVCGTTSGSIAIGAAMFDGNSHTLKFSWDAAAGTIKAKLDSGSTQIVSGLTFSCGAGYTENKMYLCSFGSSGDNCNGAMQDIKIWAEDTL